MTKRYNITTDERRSKLIKLIYEDGISIRQASFMSDISYSSAKVINKIYLEENRIEKKKKRIKKARSKNAISGSAKGG